jgi:hypothetical protein
MAQYRKKPVVIEAIQVTKEIVLSWVHKEVEKPKEICELDVWWTWDCVKQEGAIDEANSTYTGKVRTLEGDMDFKLGDWLIRGIASELYPCKNEIFIATYEPV